MRLGIEHLETVHGILKHPQVFPTIADDQTPDVDSYSIAPLLANPYAYFLMPAPGCLFTFQPLMTGIMFIGHMSVIPVMRGLNALSAGKKAIAWMFINTLAEKLVGFTPADNRAALVCAAYWGFQRSGVLTQGVSVGGERKDLIITEINKNEWLDKQRPRA